MRHQQLKPIFKQMLPLLPGFVGHKRMLLKAPIGGLLCAVHFDPSGWDKDAFYLSRFIMPMCVPEDYLHLTFGNRIRRLGERDDWSLTRPNLVPDLLRDIHTYALPFFARAHSYRAAVDVIANYASNPHAKTAMAFLLARIGDREGAIRWIDDLVLKLRVEHDWQRELVRLVTSFKKLLIEDPEAAHRQLLTWEDYTLKQLKLEQFR